MSESVCSTRRLSLATLGRRRAAALLAAASWLAVAGSAAADDWDRHPPRVSRVNRPAGVPAEYVLTRNGFFHPSCVVTLRSDEMWGRDMVIRGLDGTEHDRIAPCAYPRYSASGAPIPADAPRTGKAAERSAAARDVRHGPGGSVYDGWVVFYDYAGTVANGSGLSTQWVVPLKPSHVGAQDIAFFNDIETQDVILQPVLDFSEIPNEWAIESENCCVQNNDVQSNLVQVSPGDVILGVVTMAGCNSSDDCTNWTVTTTDMTTGMSTQLTMQNPGSNEAADEVNSAVLETYDVTSCDMYPANGEITFYDDAFTTGQGAAEPVSFDLETILQPPMYPSGFPTTCGYSGTSSGNSYTLIFGTSPTPVGPTSGGDAGAPDSGGSSSVDSGGGGEVPDASVVDASLPKDASVAIDSGSTIHGDAAMDDDDTLTPQSSSGCGCTTAGAASGSGATLLGVGLVFTLGARRRRRRAR
jgi:MYXO-CTERM domain-containing protein